MGEYEEVLEKLKILDARTDFLVGTVKVLVRAKLSNKQEKVMEEIKLRGRMTKIDIVRFVNVSEKQALTYMERIGEFPGYSYSRGTSGGRRAGIIIYENSRVLHDQIRMLKELARKEANEAGTLTLWQIMNATGYDLAQTKELVKAIAEVDDSITLKGETGVNFTVK